MNALILALAATGVVLTGLGALAIAGWADYIAARNHHRSAQKGNAHGCSPH